MKNQKKKHHFVWREYLRSWSNEKDIIPCLFKDQRKVETPTLMRIAYRNFFYSLDEFTIKEEIILKEIIQTISNDETMEVNLEFYNTFISYSRTKRELINKKLPTEKEKDIKDHLDLLKNNLMEDIHSDFEKYGSEIIKIKNLADLKFLEIQEALLKTLIFLCFQYIRTKKMRDNFEKTFKDHYVILPKYNNIISFCMASGIANSLTFHKKTKFEFCKNVSKVDFITSDQPIINMKEDVKDEKGRTIDFEFYYPISPKIAIKVHYRNNEKKFSEKIFEIDEVESHNKTLFNKSENLVFGRTKKQLESYKNCL